MNKEYSVEIWPLHQKSKKYQLLPPARIELATFALQVQRSTTKLRRQISIVINVVIRTCIDG